MTLQQAADAALHQTWPPFALVAGLLLAGVVADRDGVFTTVARWMGRTPGGEVPLFVVAMLLVATTTVVLNLDTSAAFLTPVLVRLAHRRRVHEPRFLYGCIYMSNAASLLLPGSNLTNLLVVGQAVPGAAFARDMVAGFVASVLVTGALVLLLFRGAGARPGAPPADTSEPGAGWLGWPLVVVIVVMILLLPQPSLPVLGAGMLAAAIGLVRRRVSLRTLLRAANPLVLGGLMLLAVSLGTAARIWNGPAHLVAAASPWQTAALGAVAAIGVNNLPAAVLLSSGPVPHARSLLLGLNLGPNLAVTGSLSAVIWMQAARAMGAQPSARRYSLAGLVIVPASIAAALLAFSVVQPAQL